MRSCLPARKGSSSAEWGMRNVEGTVSTTKRNLERTLRAEMCAGAGPRQRSMCVSDTLRVLGRKVRPKMRPGADTCRAERQMFSKARLAFGGDRRTKADRVRRPAYRNIVLIVLGRPKHRRWTPAWPTFEGPLDHRACLCAAEGTDEALHPHRRQHRSRLGWQGKLFLCGMLNMDCRSPIVTSGCNREVSPCKT